MTTMDAIEQLLGRWDERLRRIDDNLLALEGDPSYAMVAVPGGRERFDGRSRQRVAGALESIDTLFADQLRLQRVVEQAHAAVAAARRSRWGRDEHIAQAEALLLGPSLTRPVGPTPLDQRSLLDGTTRGYAVTPDALLSEMTRRFAEARDALVEVAAAWQLHEPAMNRIEQRLSRLDEVATRLGVGPGGIDGLVALRSEVARVHARVARDPLDAPAAFEAQLVTRFVLVESAAMAAEARWRHATEALAGVARSLDGLGARHAAVATQWRALRESTELGTAAAAIVPAASDLAGLVATLDRWRAPGGWQQVAGEVAGWQREVRAFVERLDRAAARGAALTAAGDDLGGRLAARRAQLAALRGRGVELPAGLEAWADEVQALLGRRPRALGRAAARLDALERALAARAR